MKTLKHLLLSMMVVVAQFFAPFAIAADTSIANMNVSGNVPVVFSVTARGYPGDLDLSPGVIVNSRLIGTFHMKYNVSVASMTISSSTASGMPEAAGTAYPFKAGNTFQVKFSACSSVIAANQALFTLAQAGTDVKSAIAGALTTTGFEEDCDLSASWDGTTAALPLAGKYSMTITMTMVSI